MFDKLCKDNRSDINEHLPTLLEYGRMVDHITEFGVRNGQSTLAWWYAEPKILRCYDIDPCDIHHRLMVNIEKSNELDYKFIQADVLKIEIEETDLIFFDTFHSYTQLSNELLLHGDKSSRYLIFHDTATYGRRGEDHKKPGLIQAIGEFLLDNKDWIVERNFKNNNGLLILKQKV